MSFFSSSTFVSRTFILVHVDLAQIVSIFFPQNYPESYIFFLANSNLAVLFLSVMSGLHLFVSSWL